MTTAAPPLPTVRVVVAAKVLARAKTRLVGGLPAELGGQLVLAMLTDTLVAALASPAVAELVVVTADRAVAERADGLGARVVGEADDAPGGLDAALLRGAVTGGGWVAALQGDLPALRTAELTAALRLALDSGRRSAVADAPGTGTVLLVDPDGLRPAFGPGSAQAHAASGARLLTPEWPGLRRDVDTPADLAAALDVGVGPATSAVLARSGTAATVAGVDPTAGVLLRLDDGTAVTAPPAATTAGGWRGLRTGQRVRAHHDARGGVFLVTVPALTPPG